MQADVFDGALNVAWVSGGPPGALKTAVHLGPQKQIGSSTTGWRSTQTIVASAVNSCGLMYLPEGRLMLYYADGNGAQQRYSENRGTGVAADWSAAVTGKLPYTSAQGRGQDQGFAFFGVDGGGIQFLQCRDGQGANLTTAVVAQAAAVKGFLCGGAWLDNQYGLLYSTAGGSVFFVKTANPTSWSGGGTDTTFTGAVCGIARHPSGRLVGLTQASAGGAVKALISNDQGATWTQVNLSITPTPPPVIVCIESVLYAVYISSDTPHFAASTDGGATWT